jgi:hypothetical protein
MDSATLFQRLLPRAPAPPAGMPTRIFSDYHSNGLERSCIRYADGIDLIAKCRSFGMYAGEGIEQDCHTARTVEQERDGVPIHIMQIRGSIPIFWDQVVDLKWKPKIRTVETGPSVSFSLCTSKRCLRNKSGVR